MRIVHFSDLHIGVENYGRLDPTTGLSTRMGDFLSALDELVEYSLGNDVDLVLFAGDAFKSREPKQTQQREFAKRIAKLANAGVQGVPVGRQPRSSLRVGSSYGYRDISHSGGRERGRGRQGGDLANRHEVGGRCRWSGFRGHGALSC